MTDTDHDTTTSDTSRDDFATAVAAITRAVTAANAGHGPDGAEFIAHVLATVAANLGSAIALTAARPGSWEAAGVQDLVHKTVGWNDEYLMTFRTAPIEVVVNTENELDDLGLFMTYEASADHIGRHLFGDRYAPSLVTMPGQGEGIVRRGQLSVEELEQLEPIDELLWDLQHRDYAEYRQRFAQALHAEVARIRATDPAALPDHVEVTVRFIDHTGNSDELTDLWGPGLESTLYRHARETTRLPGSNDTPDWSGYQQFAAQLLAAGHWPHLRIPELAHYGVPTNTNTEKES
jgi:hypothetical protein